MLRIAIVPLLLLLVLVPAGAAQGRRVPPPPALVAQLVHDIGPDSDLDDLPPDSVAAGIIVEGRDLDGDGTPELIVEQTIDCGSNCQKWIFRRLPGGGYRMVLSDVVAWLNVLPARSHGWHSISTWTHSSCCEGGSSLYEFDGSRYRWRETRWQRDRRGEGGGDTAMRTLYRLSITPPGTARRHLQLDPVTATNGVRIDAAYDVCSSPAACGEPWLRLASPRLPAGRVCVSVRARLEPAGRPVPHAWSDCGVTAEIRAGGRPTRTLVLHPTRPEWGMLMSASAFHLATPGAPGEIGDDAQSAVRAFAGTLAGYYHVTCPAGYGCDVEREP